MVGAFVIGAVETGAFAVIGDLVTVATKAAFVTGAVVTGAFVWCSGDWFIRCGW
jgi:hypothetical protein